MNSEVTVESGWSLYDPSVLTSLSSDGRSITDLQEEAGKLANTWLQQVIR